jgi:hypothetical protein
VQSPLLGDEAPAAAHTRSIREVFPGQFVGLDDVIDRLVGVMIGSVGARPPDLRGKRSSLSRIRKWISFGLTI